MRETDGIESLLDDVFRRLPSVFPEFGWKARHGGGWVATSRTHTKGLCGARPSRVVCLTPQGFYVFGQGATHWLAYLAGGVFPSGAAWLRAVDELRARVGAVRSRPVAPVTRPAVHHLGDQHVAVMARLVEGARGLRASYPGRGTRVLRGRGISDETMSLREMGYVSSLQEWLEVSRVRLADVRAIPGWPRHDELWEDRIVGPWRSADGELRALFGRALGESPAKYVVCGRRPLLYGHDRWMAGGRVPRRLTAVEGQLNVLELESAGVSDVSALGGNHVGDELVRALGDAGVEHLHVLFDGDEGGEEGMDALCRLQPVETITVTGGIARRGNPTVDDVHAGLEG